MFKNAGYQDLAIRVNLHDPFFEVIQIYPLQEGIAQLGGCKKREDRLRKWTEKIVPVSGDDQPWLDNPNHLFIPAAAGY